MIEPHAKGTWFRHFLARFRAPPLWRATRRLALVFFERGQSMSVLLLVCVWVGYAIMKKPKRGQILAGVGSGAPEGGRFALKPWIFIRDGLVCEGGTTTKLCIELLLITPPLYTHVRTPCKRGSGSDTSWRDFVHPPPSPAVCICVGHRIMKNPCASKGEGEPDTGGLMLSRRHAGCCRLNPRKIIKAGT